MRFRDLRPDLQEKARECQTPEEIAELAREEGVELSDEEIDRISGGWGDSEDSGMRCPECGSANVTGKAVRAGDSNWEELTCLDCGHCWTQWF